MPTEGVYLGVKTCEGFLCFLAIVSVRVCYVDCFLCFRSLVSVRGSYSEDEPTEAKASRARSVIHARGEGRENLIFRAHSPLALASLSPLFVLNTQKNIHLFCRLRRIIICLSTGSPSSNCVV